MTTVLAQIVEWSASRPIWQRDAVRRLVEAGEVDDETVQLYVRVALGEERSTSLQPIAPGHVAQAAADDARVTVSRIEDAENVNRLVPGETLTFTSTGLTIVYGDNGSGKSGYARILKTVTRARSSERVRNDIFNDRGLVPRATIGYEANGNARHVAWTPEACAPDDLSRLSFFDRACNDVYVSRETEVAFRPFGLVVFDELVGVCERVRNELDRRRADVARPIAGLPVLDAATTAGQFLQSLSHTTTDRELGEATQFTSEDAAELGSRELTEQQVQRGTAREESERLARLAERGERVRAHVVRTSAALSVETRHRLVQLSDDLKVKRAGAESARAAAMPDSQLGGVGDAVWRQMWEAARQYSQVSAYPGRTFPVLDDAACVLCHQPLDGDAAARFRAFDEFVRDTTQREAQTAEAALRSAGEALDKIIVSDQTVVDFVADIAAEDGTVAAAVSRYVEHAALALQKLKALRDAPESAGALDFPVTPLDQLDRTLLGLRGRVAELGTAQTGEAQAENNGRLVELRARKALADARDGVRKERDRRRRLNALEGARNSTSTNAITQKSAELTQAVLTDVLVDRFSRETDRLGLENVILRTVGGRRGVLRHRTGFVGAVQDAPLPEVLSEGEQTALGLAGFLAEIWTDQSKSGVILDDPVSSLDHERRDKVAERVVTLAGERQTIVFTHDVAFVLALKKHAVRLAISVTERSIEKRGSQPGHCGDFHKFSAKLMKERLQELDAAIKGIREDQGAMSTDQYRDATAKWYRLLRRSWERAIEESLVGKVLTRDDLQVHPAMVRTLVLFTADDNRELQYGYGRATELSEVHEESAVINSPAATLADLERDLAALRKWHKRIVARENRNDRQIYELAKMAAGAPMTGTGDYSTPEVV
jgi:energy-coupling factor transporter ATP-binding protein EcfA2